MGRWEPFRLGLGVALEGGGEQPRSPVKEAPLCPGDRKGERTENFFFYGSLRVLPWVLWPRNYWVIICHLAQLGAFWGGGEWPPPASSPGQRPGRGAVLGPHQRAPQLAPARSGGVPRTPQQRRAHHLSPTALAGVPMHVPLGNCVHRASGPGQPRRQPSLSPARARREGYCAPPSPALPASLVPAAAPGHRPDLFS